MKRSVIVILLLSCNSLINAQNPVHWNYTAKKVSDVTYEVHLAAIIDEGWHVYAQAQPKQAIAQPTKILFSKNPLVIINGKPKETGRKEKYENKEVGIIQYQYADSVEFVQTITLKAKVKTNIAGTITYQICTEEKCLPAKTIAFSIKIE